MHFNKNFETFATNLTQIYVMLVNFENFDKHMSKILRVKEPIMNTDVDDTFVLSEDGKFYVIERSEEFRTANSGSDDSVTSIFNSTFKISPSCAKELIDDGFLEEVVETKKESTSFINVFDEIDTLIKKYSKDLENIPTDMANEPECLKVEKTTVLTNMLNVLNHLKSLRK